MVVLRYEINQITPFDFRFTRSVALQITNLVYHYVMRKLFIHLSLTMCFALGTHGPGWSAETQTGFAAHRKDKNKIGRAHV